MLSFWERENLVRADVIIIGGGLVGLSSACSIKEKNPGCSVIVLERGILPSGASTRNAGFACFSDVTEALHDISLSNEDKAIDLMVNRFRGLELLRKRLGDAAIGFEPSGGYEPLLKDTAEQIDQSHLDYLNKLLFPFFGQNIFSFVNERIAGFGFKKVEKMILNPLEGGLNTGMLVDNLWRYANNLGVRVITGAEVTEFDETDTGVDVFVHHHTLHANIPFRAQQIVLASNALIGEFLPETGIVPGRGQVIITKPLEKLPFRGIFHFDEGYYYFRNVGNRILLGGGRNLDFEKEKSPAFESNPLIVQSLITHLEEMIIPGVDFEIDMHWQGIMAFTNDKLPKVYKVTDSIIAAFSCNGMGVALSSNTGERVSELL